MATKTYTTGTIIDSASMNDFDAAAYQGEIPATATALPFQRKNQLINPNFLIWQRGPTLNAIANNAYCADRWKVTYNNAPTINVTRQARAASAAIRGQFVIRVENAAAAATWAISQSLEQSRAEQFKGKTVLVSVWLRKGSALTADLTLSGGTTAVEGGIAPNQATFSLAIPNASLSTTTWTKFSTSVAVANSVTDVGFCFIITAASQAGAANAYFEAANAQLEIASPGTNTVTGEVEEKGFETELAECQRFFQKSFEYATPPAQNAGQAGEFMYPITLGGANISYSPRYSFPVRMRIAPTMTFFNPVAANAFLRNLNAGTDATTTGTEGNSIGQTGFNVTATGLAPWTVGQVAAVHWTASAEF